MYQMLRTDSCSQCIEQLMGAVSLDSLYKNKIVTIRTAVNRDKKGNKYKIH